LKKKKSRSDVLILLKKSPLNWGLSVFGVDMGKRIDLTGQTFGEWLVIKKAAIGNVKSAFWECRCSCGTIKIIRTDYLRRKNPTKCLPCAQKNKTPHGMNRRRIKDSWRGMISRCKERQSYIKNGITVCEEWKNDFLAFYAWAISNGYSDNLTLDRINTLGNYAPSNCRWLTHKEQQSNRTNNIRTDDGTMAATIAENNGISRNTFYSRLHAGWSMEDATTKPVMKMTKNAP
jgi:hypothetical protein